MTKLFVAALALGTLAATTMVVSAGCASSSTPGEEDPTGSASSAVGSDAASDAGVAKGVLVISQVFAGGGRTGAPLKRDFVELFNKSTKPVTLDGLSLQLSTSATTDFTVVVPLTGTVPSGGYFLVELASAGGSGDPLAAAADIPGDGSSPAISTNGKDGKVALASSTTALNCGGIGKLCPTGVLDLLGFGTASLFEGTTSAPAFTDNTKAAIRTDACSDADSNAKEFMQGTPNPRTGATTPKPCPVTPPKMDAAVEASVAPPVKDPDLGPETAFDAGFRPEGGAAPQSGGTSGDCAVSTVGANGWNTATGLGIFSPLAGLAIGALYIVRRRRRSV